MERVCSAQVGRRTRPITLPSGNLMRAGLAVHLAGDRTLHIWLFLALACPQLTLLARAANAASVSRRAVVSYLVSGSQDSIPVVPEELMPSTRLAAHSWQWRAFDPASGHDGLIFDLPSFPTHIQWDPSYDSVQFVLSNQIMRAAWRAGAPVVPQALLPIDSALCTFWRDAASHAWHAVTQREVRTPAGEGRVEILQIATRWDLMAPGLWRVAVVDSGGDANGGCFASERVYEGTERTRTISLATMLDSMRIGHQRYSTLREVRGESYDRLVYVPSAGDSSLGVEVRVGFGDSEHAMEPVVWVNRSRQTRKTVFGRRDSHDGSFGQIAFTERGGLLLIASEYSGAFPTVVDLRSGKILFSVRRASARAAWVPAPR
jgi:hypothetical protein